MESICVPCNVLYEHGILPLTDDVKNIRLIYVDGGRKKWAELADRMSAEMRL